MEHRPLPITLPRYAVTSANQPVSTVHYEHPTARAATYSGANTGHVVGGQAREHIATSLEANVDRYQPVHSVVIRPFDQHLFGIGAQFGGSDIGSRQPQQRAVEEDVSRRESNQADQFPFLCVFHFAGCDQKFANKRDFRTHVINRHRPEALDQRLNHAAEHFLASPQCIDVFGGENDAELVQWASSDKVGIHEKAPNACLDKNDGDKSVADSGSSSMPGMSRQPNMPQQDDSSPMSPPKAPESTSDDAPFYGRSMDELYLGAGFVDGSPETAAVMRWFHGWLQRWLLSLTQERPSGSGDGNGSSPHTASQSPAGSSTQKKQGTARPRRAPKRKKGKDDEDDGDDGNGDSLKSRRVDPGQPKRMLACPFFKRNPHKYGDRRWKSCAYPGYETMHRLKEHIERKHSLPEYQCRRCRVDLKTSEALEVHSQQLQACTPCIGNQDGLTQDQIKRMKSKKGTRRNKSDIDRWNDVYSIIFPYDQQKPSPYLDDTDKDKNAREFNLCYEFGRFLTRELPPLVGRRLSTVGCPLPTTIKDDIEQYVKGMVPQLQVSFLEEMGFAAGGQLDVASTTYDGESLAESTTTRRTSEDSATTVQQDSTSEYPTTTLPKGSTSQEAMSMFPTSGGSKELTVMPQVGYDTANSTMFQDGNFSGQDMMFPASQMIPPCFSTTNEDWQAFLQFGYNPNLP